MTANLQASLVVRAHCFDQFRWPELSIIFFRKRAALQCYPVRAACAESTAQPL